MILVISKHLNRSLKTMATNISRYSLLPLGALALGTLASCSLPPKQAWQQIQKEGLIPYVASEIRAKRATSSEPAPATAPASTSSASMVAQTQPKPQTDTSLIGPSNPATSPVANAPITPSLPPPSQIPAQSLPVAAKVEGLVGYVRSPFTNPPRLVDVRGMGAGSKVVCPYTRKPFLVPSGIDAVPSNMAAAPAPAPTPTPAPLPTVASTGIKPLPKPQLPPSNLVKEPPTQPTKVAAVTPAPTQPPVQPKPESKPMAPPANNPPSLPKTAPTQPAPSAPAPAPATAPQEIPMGTAIVGRPGFVNSPYAAKHQLVDVTGLPTGMEVKCPYTGKLFRVPPQANAPKN